MSCLTLPQEAAAYLHHTYALWVRIVGSQQAATKITVNDVQAVELRCPKFCTADAVAVMDAFEQGTIFSSFSTSERDAIRREILSIETIITSLYTFSQDIHVLEVCAASMRHLVAPSRNRTIRQTLLSSFEGTDDRSAATAIQDLWAFVLGNFPDMCLPTTRTKAKLLAGPLVQEGRQATVLCAARLANQLGFRTPEIQRLVSKSDGEPADGRETDACEVQAACQSTSNHDSEVMALVVGGQSCCRRLQRRCGRPRRESHQLDRKLLTRANLDADVASLNLQGRELTSFFVLRCQYVAFFGSRASGDSPTRQQSGANAACKDHTEDAVQAPLSLEKSIQELRRCSDASEYTSVTVVEESSDAGCHATDHSMPVENVQEVSQPTRLQILFKEFSDGRFHDVAEVDASDPAAVMSAAKELKREDRALLSVDLDFVRPDECFDTALSSGANAIIVVPNNNVRMSEDLKQAARQLRRGDTMI